MIKLIKDIIKYFLRFEFIRFGIIGVLNTIVDFGLLNILMFATKINIGIGFIIIRNISFICATLVSFPLNKDWTFKDSSEEKRFKFFKFFVVTLVTLFINNILAGYLVEKNYFYLNQYLWANIATFLGAIVALLTRYVLFKNFVFKKNNKRSTN